MHCKFAAPTKPHASLSPAEVIRTRAEKVKQYVEGWKSDVDMPSRMNVMNSLVLLAVACPIAGLLFAWASYGHLWGVEPGYLTF